MKVVVRTDASITLGSGHLMRCLTLAGQLRARSIEVVFVCRDIPGAMFEQIAELGHDCLRLPHAGDEIVTTARDARETITAVRARFPDGVDWIIVDHYALDAVWESALRAHCRHIMVIDDLADRRHDCDILLDQNYYLDLENRYVNLIPAQCIALCGPAYTLLRPEFAEFRAKPRVRGREVRRMLVFFGGSDATNQTGKVLRALELQPLTHCRVDVVVGTSNPHRREIEDLCSRLPGIEYHCQVSNMAELIAQADLGVGAGGAAMWERCYLGLPTITVVFADNQLQATEAAAAIGVIDYLGWATTLSIQDYADAIGRLIETPGQRKDMEQAALQLFQRTQASAVEVMLSFA